MAVAEAITNLLAAPIELPRVKLSANWMAACGEPGEDAALYATVKAVGMELCPALGISIPVGKDSLSMRTQWKDEDGAPEKGHLAGVPDRHRLCHAGRRARHAHAATERDRGHHAGADRPGPGPEPHGRPASWRKRWTRWATTVPDLDDPQDLVNLVNAVNALRAQGQILAYHDRSDGGLLAAVVRDGVCRPHGRGAECGHAGDRGRRHHRQPHGLGDSKNWAGQVSARREELTLKALFSEELGVVLQVRTASATR